MKVKLTENDIINWWLKKYHDITIEEIMKDHPEYEEDSREFFRKYAVTQEQQVAGGPLRVFRQFCRSPGHAQD